MSKDLLFQARQNSLIAIVRVFQAGLSLASVCIEPDRPGSLDNFATHLLTAYFAISVLLLPAPTVWRGAQRQLFLAAFILDTAVFGVVLYLTAGSTSPFFSVFLLLVLSATLQWSWQGAAWATAATLLVFLPTSLPIYEQLTGFHFDPSRFLLRVGTLFSVGGLLVVFGRHQERVGREMLRLGGPGPIPTASEQPPIGACLEHAVAVFGLRHGSFIWGDPKAPSLVMSRLTPSEFNEYLISNDVEAAHRAFEDADRPFVFDGDNASSLSVRQDGGVTVTPCAIADNPALGPLVATRSLVIPVKATGFTGWVILPDLPFVRRESLYLASTVAAQLVVCIEGWRSLVSWRDAALTEKRLGLARDLHDGTLQFLAGMAMQLTAVSRGLSPAQEAQRARIARLQEDLQAEQRQLRELIEALGPSDEGRRVLVDLVAEVQKLVVMLKAHWDVEVSLTAETADGKLPGRLVFELLQIVREAISNAVRHGNATMIEIALTRGRDGLSVHIADNGGGMPLTGAFEMEDLTRLAVGPRMLRLRVARLGGRLSVLSGADGLSLNIELPLLREAAAA
jgi:signal transduction histidine kinase